MAWNVNISSHTEIAHKLVRCPVLWEVTNKSVKFSVLKVVKFSHSIVIQKVANTSNSNYKTAVNKSVKFSIYLEHSE